MAIAPGDTIGLCIRYFLDGTSSSGSVYPTSCVLTANQQSLYVDVATSTGAVAVPPGGSKSAALVAYPNPVPLTQGDPAVVNGVPAGGSVTIVSAAGRHIRRIEGDQGRCAWDLRSDRGTRAAPGVYLVIVRDAAEQQVGSTRLTLAR